jgi:pyruvate formate lyase activating enzyme
MIREAMLYDKLSDSRVQCVLCAHRCKINPGRRGLCGVRENRDGILYSLVFGTLIAEHVDPIEKKPFFHVYPGSQSYSIATVGCNFSCEFCQNHEISQMPRATLMIMGEDMMPESIVERGKKTIAKQLLILIRSPPFILKQPWKQQRLPAGKACPTSLSRMVL